MNSSKAFTEVEEVLNNISKIEYEKIPQEIINIIHNNKDKNYIWNYDPDKSLTNQNLCKEAAELLSYIIMNYLIDKRDKEILEEELKEKYQIINNIEMRKVLSYDEMFSKKEIVQGEKEEQNNLPVLKEGLVFQKIKRIINKLFKR